MYSTATYNLTFRKGCNFNAKRCCCSPKQRMFKRDAYIATYDLDNKLQTFGNKTITYDNDGNMTSGPIIEGGNNAALEFNARGQLMGTGDVAYAYDLENTRTIVMHYDKNKILTQYRYVYNRVGNVPEVLMRVKLTNMTSQSTYYVYGAGLAYEVKITPDGQEAVRYYHYDQVGSTVAMTDSAQAITDRFHYDPWGYVLHSIGDSDTPFQFVGAYGIQTDPNGLINMRARYYNPVTKSFISQDPSGFNGGLNWYLYANGNPFTYVDIDGKTFIDNMSLLYDFITGSGETNRSYDDNHPLTQEFINSPAGRNIVNQFYANDAQTRTDIRYGTFTAAINTLWRVNNVSMQIGGYGGASALNNGNGTVTYTVNNVAGAKSFFYHAPFVSNKQGDTGMFRSINQTFKWTTNIDYGRLSNNALQNIITQNREASFIDKATNNRWGLSNGSYKFK